MGRLTERNKDGTWYKNCEGCPSPDYGFYCTDCEETVRQRDKLAYYEDCEEQGRVIELPLAEGDTLYEISNDYSYISKETVSGFAIIKEFGTYILLGIVRKPIHAANLGRMIFRTREEAEAKLKEMKEDNNVTDL